MPLSIKNPKADRLARELARLRCVSITEAVRLALVAEHEREIALAMSQRSDAKPDG